MSNQANTVEVQSLYGNNAITSGELTADEKALLAGSSVEVRDGDDLITVDGGEEEDPNAVQLDTEKKPDEGGEEEEEAEDQPAPLLAITEQTTDELVMEGLKQRQDAFQEASSKVAAAGIDPAAVVSEYQTDGKLSDDTYKALEGAGYTKEAVDAMIQDQNDQTQAYYKAVYAHAGGDAGFQRLATFAQANDPAAAAQFNTAIEAGDLEACKAIIGALKGKLAAKYGTANKGLQGKPAGAKPVNAAKPFENGAEMTKAMSDKRYGRDAAYTKSVEARVLAG